MIAICRGVTMVALVSRVVGVIEPVRGTCAVGLTRLLKCVEVGVLVAGGDPWSQALMSSASKTIAGVHSLCCANLPDWIGCTGAGWP